MLTTVLCTLAACDVQGIVRIDVDEDGSGVVSVSAVLDSDTVEQLGDPLYSVVVNDLEGAGWVVAEPRASGDLTVFEATRSFEHPDDLAAVMDEVGGADGVFRDIELVVTDRFAATQYELSGRVVSSGSLTDFGDPGVAELLDGESVGYSPDELETLLATTDGSVRLDVEVSLPGSDRSDTSVVLSGGQPSDVAIDTTSTVRHRRPYVWFVLALAAALAAVALAVLAGSARGSDPREGGGPRSTSE